MGKRACWASPRNCCRAPARQHTILGISLDPVLRADLCEVESGSGVCLSFLLIVVIPGNSTFEDFFFGGGIKQYFFDCVRMFSFPCGLRLYNIDAS